MANNVESKTMSLSKSAAALPSSTGDEDAEVLCLRCMQVFKNKKGFGVHFGHTHNKRRIDEESDDAETRAVNPMRILNSSTNNTMSSVTQNNLPQNVPAARVQENRQVPSNTTTSVAAPPQNVPAAPVQANRQVPSNTTTSVAASQNVPAVPAQEISDSKREFDEIFDNRPFVELLTRNAQIANEMRSVREKLTGTKVPTANLTENDFAEMGDALDTIESLIDTFESNNRQMGKIAKLQREKVTGIKNSVAAGYGLLERSLKKRKTN